MFFQRISPFFAALSFHAESILRQCPILSRRNEYDTKIFLDRFLEILRFQYVFHESITIHRSQEKRPCSQGGISGTGPGRVLPFMPPVAPFRVMCPDSRRTPASSSGVAADIGRSYTHPGRRSVPDGQAGVLSSPGYSQAR